MWVENVNRSSPTKFVPVKDSRICSEHFSADMFEERHGEKAVLKPYAVITLLRHYKQQEHTKLVCPTRKIERHLMGMVAKKFTLIRNQFYCNKFING